MTVLYFAYGSNLLSRRLQARTPTARPVGVGLLRGHVLRWHMSAVDVSGKCDVVQVDDPASAVHGVVYEIAAVEMPLLDRAETLGVGYRKAEVPIELVDRSVTASVYIALTVDSSLAPYDWYKAYVVGGAKEHGIDPAYVAALEAVRAVPDPDAARAEFNFRLTRPD
ncbi:MAG: gamma-glutamylcyclotransferase [Proteobacteria bacterium]|nr:gamma-glutamylcyclotransferase [Pseudomonadota bacterium]